jgi:NAD(P)-dependent dehydrogenase (short-subunit alcohol dehydrogenase family)
MNCIFLNRTQKSRNMSSLFDLSGKTALVTGGGTGIGACIAEGLANAGANVVLLGRREGPLKETAEKINSNYVDAARAAYLANKDLSAMKTPEEFTQLVTEAAECFQDEGEELTPVTIVVNNAGMNYRKPAAELEPMHWENSFDLMVRVPFELTRACAPQMSASNFGRVISIASLQSYQAFPDSLPYASSKSGILGMTRALSEAYSPRRGFNGITVNAIAPGYVQTSLTASVFADKERAQALADKTILGRNSVPEDLVGPAIFLCSGASCYVTGQTLPVDGGFGSLGCP